MDLHTTALVGEIKIREPISFAFSLGFLSHFPFSLFFFVFLFRFAFSLSSSLFILAFLAFLLTPNKVHMNEVSYAKFNTRRVLLQEKYLSPESTRWKDRTGFRLWLVQTQQTFLFLFSLSIFVITFRKVVGRGVVSWGKRQKAYKFNKRLFIVLIKNVNKDSSCCYPYYWMSFTTKLYSLKLLL